MKVYIMRHGEAGYSASSDASRSLTAKGNEQCALIARWFNEQQITFDLAFVSPYVRAQQTFALVANLVPVQQVQTDELLTPGGYANLFANQLNILPNTIHSVLVVSHLPLVGYLVNELCSNVGSPMFSTAEVACVSLSSNGDGVLEWLHRPV